MRWLLYETPLLTFAFLAIAWAGTGLWIVGTNLADLKPLILLVSGIITVLLPLAFGIACDFRYRLWHCFVWIAIIAAQLSCFAQG